MQENKTCRGLWLRHSLFIVLGFIVCMLIIIAAQLFYRVKLVQGLDIKALEESTYQMVYISSDKCSQFPYSTVNNFYTEPVQGYVYRDGRDSNYELIEVLQCIQESSNTGINIYMELNPLLHNENSIIQLLSQQSQNKYYIYLKPFSEQEWDIILDKELAPTYVEAYQSMASKLTMLDNIRVFYPGEHDWIVQNPSYFNESNQMSEDGIMQIYSEMEFNASGLMHTEVTQDNINQKIVPAETNLYDYVDLANANIFYLGDSMYGKDKDTSGITSITSELLTAQSYNFAIMGTSFSGEDEKSFNAIVDLLIANQSNEIEDMMIPDELVDEIEKSYAVIPEIIVLRYGFNDFSAQIPLEEDGHFFESVICGIQKLKEKFPDAKLIISTPTITSIDFGFELELKDYVDAMIKIAEQEEVYCLNNYNVDIFTEDDPNETLIDGVHYNVKGRFRQAERLAEYITSIYTH